MKNTPQTAGNILGNMPSGGGLPGNEQRRPYKPMKYELGYHLSPNPHPELVGLHKAAQWFINDAANKMPPRWLSMLGVSGVGKTHLARAIIDRLKEVTPPLGRLIQMFPWSRVVNHLRNGDSYFLRYLTHEVDILAVDDIGAEYGTEFTQANLYQLMEGRLGKWTVFTSNMTMQQIQTNIDTRIASRLVRGGSVVIEVTEAPDYSLARYMGDGMPDDAA